MKVSQLLLVCAALGAGSALFAGPASAAPGSVAVDEASIYAQIRALQNNPDASQRAWLRGWLDYASQERIDFDEGRGQITLPRYPIADAAGTALFQLDLREAVQDLRRTPPRQPLEHTAEAVSIAAWSRWLAGLAQLPTIVEQAPPEHRWPEAVLRVIAAHPSAGPQWTQRLLAQAQDGASLRWLERQLSALEASALEAGAANDAVATLIWREWARRANAGDRGAAQRLQAAWDKAQIGPGVIAGLSQWDAGPDLARSVLGSKSITQDTVAQAQLARLVLIQHAELPRATLYDEARP